MSSAETRLAAHVARLEEALRFYADRSKYDNSGPSKWFPLCEDEGEIARAALSGTGEPDDRVLVPLAFPNMGGQTDLVAVPAAFLKSDGKASPDAADMRERAAKWAYDFIVNEHDNSTREGLAIRAERGIRALPLTESDELLCGARVEAAAVDMRERAAKEADKRRNTTGRCIAAAIRALPVTEGKADD